MEGLVSKPGVVCGGETCEVNGGGVVRIGDGGGDGTCGGGGVAGFGEGRAFVGSLVGCEVFLSSKPT